MYKNKEGYTDPTAGAAMATIMKEYRQNQRRIYRKHSEIKARPKVYVVSKYAGDIEGNTGSGDPIRPLRHGEKVPPRGQSPAVPADSGDGDPEQRELGLLFGQALLALCEEVWVFGTKHSSGMQAEIHEAHRLKKRIRYYSERLEEIHEDDR